jgi:GTP cyclohydrolase I
MARHVTEETAEFLFGILQQVTVSGSDPNLVETAQRIQNALTELTTEVPDLVD